MTTADDYDNNHILTHVDTNTLCIGGFWISLYMLEGGIDLVVSGEEQTDEQRWHFYQTTHASIIVKTEIISVGHNTTI